ncbi:MAG: NADH-quinone oxidoreductase subunit NuoB, partial [Bdellovibrionota bacterium]
MKGSVYLSTVDRVFRWARANSLWYITAGQGCCADEIMDVFGAKYDLERFGCIEQVDPRQADLLIVSGAISHKASPYLRELYESMLPPRFVMAVGSCAISGGAFSPAQSYSTLPGADKIIPVDVYVPGCPPRPEAIMN